MKNLSAIGESKLSNQEKIKIFSMYLGSEVIIEKSCYWLVHERLIYAGTVKELNPGMLDIINRTIGDAEIKLLLTPLKDITDEHAIEVAKLYGNENLTDESVPYMINHGKHIINLFLNGTATLKYECADKLRELGYALPYKGIDLFEAGIAINKNQS